METLVPLRYPGGKRWFVPYAKKFVLHKRPKVFVEPFAGGASVSLSLLKQGLVDHIVLVELDHRVAAFWSQAIYDANFSKKVAEFKCNKTNVEAVIADRTETNLAFWTLVQNRCGYGGILDSGLLQKGDKCKCADPSICPICEGTGYEGVKSRWNSTKLVTVMEDLYRLRKQITFIEGDGIQKGLEEYNSPENAAFIDPPYVVAAKTLYQHHEFDHKDLFVRLTSWSGRWVATYDDVPLITGLADAGGIAHQRIPMRTRTHALKHELIISPDLGDWF